MKKIIPAFLILTLAMLACEFTPTDVPSISTSTPQPISNIPTKTQADLITPTTVSISQTSTATATSISPTDTLDAPTATIELNPTVTAGASITETVIPTSTQLPEGQAGTPTLTPTLGIMTYGTLPPAVPSSQITLINRSKAQAYISLQNHPSEGSEAILEYPVKGRVEVRAPLGYYVYVTWVGGKQIVGNFTLNKDSHITIIIYKDKVIIQ